MKRPRRNEHGFTLIEILLTVTITAIIMILVYGVLIGTIDASKRVEEIMEGGDIGPAILNIIRQDVEEVILPGDQKEYFVGLNNGSIDIQHDQIDFITTNLAIFKEKLEYDKTADRFSSINEVGFQLKENPKEKNLFILYRRESPSIDDNPLKGGTLSEIYDRVKSFNVEYYNGEKWTEEWNSLTDKGLPSAVRVELIIHVDSPKEGEDDRQQRYVMIVPIVR